MSSTPYQRLLARRFDIYESYVNVHDTPTDTLDALAFAARDLAPLVIEGDLHAHEVWDNLHSVAQNTKLVARFGQDVVQALFAEAVRFHETAKRPLEQARAA